MLKQPLAGLKERVRPTRLRRYLLLATPSAPTRIVNNILYGAKRKKLHALKEACIKLKVSPRLTSSSIKAPSSFSFLILQKKKTEVFFLLLLFELLSCYALTPLHVFGSFSAKAKREETSNSFSFNFNTP